MARPLPLSPVTNTSPVTAVTAHEPLISWRRHHKRAISGDPVRRRCEREAHAVGISPSESGGASLPPRLDTSSAHSARVWNYLLGGKDNFAADREVGDMILQMFPGIAHIARLQRRVLGRAVRYLAGEAGIRQFLDIGTGLPTADNTHEVAQAIAPESRIVYVDNDPLVLVHARALLTSTPEGATDYIDADMHDPDKILAEAARTLDFTQPVAVTMLGVVIFISDDGEAYGIVRRFLDALPSGSYLVLSHTITSPTM